MKNSRTTLHKLIGEREKAEKRMNDGNIKAEEDYLTSKKEVEDFLKEHPELKTEVEKIENHFIKKLYGK